MIRFLPVKRNQIQALTRLEKVATPYPWSAQNLIDSLETSADCCQIEHQGQTIGYYVVQRVLDEAELLNIVIFKSFQSQGFGSKVIRKLQLELAASGIKSLFLEVRVSNNIAIALYTKTGFEVMHTRLSYYRAGEQETEDALVMRSVLKPKILS